MIDYDTIEDIFTNQLENGSTPDLAAEFAQDFYEEMIEDLTDEQIDAIADFCAWLEKRHS